MREDGKYYVIRFGRVLIARWDSSVGLWSLPNDDWGHKDCDLEFIDERRIVREVE